MQNSVCAHTDTDTIDNKQSQEMQLAAHDESLSDTQQCRHQQRIDAAHMQGLGEVAVDDHNVSDGNCEHDSQLSLDAADSDWVDDYDDDDDDDDSMLICDDGLFDDYARCKANHNGKSGDQQVEEPSMPDISAMPMAAAAGMAVAPAVPAAEASAVHAVCQDETEGVSQGSIVHGTAAPGKVPVPSLLDSSQTKSIGSTPGADCAGVDAAAHPTETNTAVPSAADPTIIMVADGVADPLTALPTATVPPLQLASAAKVQLCLDAGVSAMLEEALLELHLTPGVSLMA